MLTLDEFALKQIFKQYVSAIPEDEGHDTLVYVATVEDGYIYVWPDGRTHHSYRHPERLDYIEKSWDDN